MQTVREKGWLRIFIEEENKSQQIYTFKFKFRNSEVFWLP